MASKEEKTEVDQPQPVAPAEEEIQEPAAASETKVKSDESTDKSDEEKPASKPSEGSKQPSETAAEGDDDERGKRVYVGNLAWQVSWQDLKDHMKSTGLEVTHANVLTAPDGRSKGCGIVEFATSEDAMKAVEEFNDSELKGRQIFVREDREDSRATISPTPTAAAAGSITAGGAPAHGFSGDESAQSRRVYVGNLSWDVAWQDLKDHMKSAGEVVHAEVISDQHTGRSKGCGVVEFSTDSEAQQAIEELSGTELKGRTIFVREDRETTSKVGGGGPAVPGGRTQNPSVYVWNLAPETSWQDLKDHMRKAGNVDSATVFTSSDGETNSGIVVYQRPQEAARAIRELQGSKLHGVAMNLREDRMHTSGRGGGGGRGAGGRGRGRGGRGGGTARGGDRGAGGERSAGAAGAEPGTQVFVGNLSFETTWKDLKDHFRQCGDVKRTEVKTNAQGNSRGFGTVQFFSRDDAEAAINDLNGSELHGRKLEVRLDSKTR